MHTEPKAKEDFIQISWVNLRTKKKRKDPQVEFKKGSNIRRNKDQLIYNICHRDILTSDFW